MTTRTVPIRQRRLELLCRDDELKGSRTKAGTVSKVGGSLEGMTMTRKRIEIVVETEREVVLTRQSDTVTFCPRCKQASMIIPEDAATLAAVSVGSVRRWIETGSLHFTETEDEGLLACEMSLGSGVVASQSPSLAPAHEQQSR